MKKFLSFVLALVVVLSLSANVVFADEYVENIVSMYEANGMSTDALAEEFAKFGLVLDAEAMKILDASTGEALSEEEVIAIMSGGAPSATGNLTEEDYASEKFGYIVEKVGEKKLEGDTEKKLYFKATVYLMGTDAYLDYVLGVGEQQQTPFEEGKFQDKRAVKLDEIEVDTVGLADSLNIGYVEEKGFFATEELYFVPMGDCMNVDRDQDGTPDYVKDQVVSTYVFKNGDDVAKFDIVAGKLNTIMHTRTSVNWIAVLIVALGVIVVILGVLIVLFALRGKKKVEKENSLKEENFVSEDKVFEELVAEAGIEAEEEITEEVAEDAVEEAEEAAEETEEEVADEETEVK